MTDPFIDACVKHDKSLRGRVKLLGQLLGDVIASQSGDDVLRTVERLRKGEDVPPGPQDGRQGCAPKSGPNTLTDPAIYGSDDSGPEPGYAGTSDPKSKMPGPY